MKIHKIVNPVAYENTYYLEGEKHLIVVDPGSHWEAIRKSNKPTWKDFQYLFLASKKPSNFFILGFCILLFNDVRI